MAVIKQGGGDPYRKAGMVMTSMGYRRPRPPYCQRCGERRDSQIYTTDMNGLVVCADCANPKDRELLTGCAADSCACGTREDDGSAESGD